MEKTTMKTKQESKGEELGRLGRALNKSYKLFEDACNAHEQATEQFIIDKDNFDASLAEFLEMKYPGELAKRKKMVTV
jgi:hypothetical protein